jgi:murein DD-endopeptidase MepM/ murein hydrolase activator NlpD
MDGRVAGIIRNRPPYGNAVIIETPLDMLPAGWKGPIPTPAPTVPPAGNLFCPPDPIHTGAGSERSLYLLYAHMNQTPNLTIGQAVGCGEVIGEVGTTGKSVNYHLHLETRAGPAGTQFASMAHYDNAASDEEMRNYCAWRVSGLFQMIDPLELLR